MHSVVSSSQGNLLGDYYTLISNSNSENLEPLTAKGWLIDPYSFAYLLFFHNLFGEKKTQIRSKVSEKNAEQTNYSSKRYH